MQKQVRGFACFMLLFLLALAGTYSFGQATATGTIQGTVTDKSNAVVSGAHVTATFKATGLTRTATTNETGSYRFDLLQAGTYEVKIAKEGFATVAQTAELLVGQSASVNATLNPGAATTVVEVTGAATLVDVDKTSVSQNITPSEVSELPLVGRDAANLAYLAPGVKATDSYDPTKNRYAVLSINGSDGRNVNTTINGVDNKDNTVGGAVMQMPLEAIQEFQISTQRFSAENGRSQGAAINMITKSGTNDYHGSVFGYFRTSALDTEEKVANGDGTSSPNLPDYSRQFFGGSIGGPIKKDKLFAFWAMERQRESQGLSESGTSYAELVLAQQAGLDAQPAKTIPRPFHEWRYNGRLDWTINSRNNAYVSYSSQANDSLNDQADGTQDLTAGNFTLNHLQIANVTLTSQLSSSAINTFTAGFQYWNNLIASHTQAPLITFPDASFGTNGNVPQQSFQRKWQFKDDFSKTIGKHTFKGGVDFIHNPVEGGFFEFNSTLEVDFVANPSCILGIDTSAGCGPSVFPDGFASAGAVTSMSYSNGDPYFLVATKQLGFYGQDDWKVSPRLTLNLGLRWDRDFNMLGMSDYKNSRTYQSLLAISSDPAAQQYSNYYVRSLPHDGTKDFSPRIGFAYDMTGRGKHMLRGGFGLYFGNVFQNIPLFMEQLANPTIFQTVLSLSQTDAVPCAGGQTVNQWSYSQAAADAVVACLPGPSTTAADGSVGRLIDPGYRNPVSEEFNVGYSWAINNNSVFEAEFTHVLGLHENKTINIDQRVVSGQDTSGTPCTAPGTPLGCNLYYGSDNLARPLSAAFANAGQPVLASVRNDESINRQHYDGINFSFRQRMSHHFSLNTNYTLSWAYGYDAGGFTAFRNYARDGYHPFASYEWGPMTNDERHHITVSGLVNLPKGFEFAPILQFGTARPYALTNSYNAINAGGGTTNAVIVPISDQRNFTYGPDFLSSFVSQATTNDPTIDPADALAAAKQQLWTCYYESKCTMGKFDPVRGQAFFELDAKLAKDFKLGERVKVQIVAQAFNLTNRANYGNNYGGDVSSSTFGHPVGFINPSSTFTPRSIWSEFGVHLTF